MIQTPLSLFNILRNLHRVLKYHIIKLRTVTLTRKYGKGPAWFTEKRRVDFSASIKSEIIRI